MLNVNSNPAPVSGVYAEANLNAVGTALYTEFAQALRAVLPKHNLRLALGQAFFTDEQLAIAQAIPGFAECVRILGRPRR